MDLRTKDTAPPRRRAAWALVLPVAAAAVAATVGHAAPGSPVASAKPVIGAPVAIPRQPVAGQRFGVSFRVTRSDTGAPLLVGRMDCRPSIAGKGIRHSDSFTRGTARLSLVVPATSAGKLLKVKVTITSAGRSATRVAAFRVKAVQVPSVAVADVSAAEGTGGATTLSVPVTLSTASARVVSVGFATADGTAAAPSDYAAATGTVTFQPGESAKTIPVQVVGDTAIESDETLTVTISSSVNASISNATATATITNDDVAAPVAPGAYKGETQNRNHVFFDVLGDRTIANFRINDLPMSCTPGDIRIMGGSNYGKTIFLVAADGTFRRALAWTGLEVDGDAEWLKWEATLTGAFTTATTVTGTVVENQELKYRGVSYRCSTGQVSWSASLQS